MEIQRKLLHFLAIQYHRKDGRNRPLLQATEARRVCMQCKLCTWIQSLTKNNRYLVTRKTLSAAPVSTSCKILKWILRINGKQFKKKIGQSMCSWRWYREGQCMNGMRHIYFFINYINCILDPWDDEWRNKSKWCLFWNASVDFHVAPGSRRVGGGSSCISAAPGAGATPTIMT